MKYRNVFFVFMVLSCSYSLFVKARVVGEAELRQRKTDDKQVEQGDIESEDASGNETVDYTANESADYPEGCWSGLTAFFAQTWKQYWSVPN